MDTPLEIAREKYIDKHLFKCGTCEYLKKGRCSNDSSDAYEELVDDSCSCDSYVPERGLYI